MRDRFAINLLTRTLLVLVIVIAQSVFAAKSSKWKKRFIQSTDDGTASTSASLPADGLTCTDGVVKLNRNLEVATETTDVVSMTFPITKNGLVAPAVKCGTINPPFYVGSTGAVMNSGSVSATCIDGHFHISANCKVQGNESCALASGGGTGISIFNVATDTMGPCVVDTCYAGYSNHQGTQCLASQIACSIANGTGYHYYNGAPYSACTLASCNTGYLASGNTCIATRCKVGQTYNAGGYVYLAPYQIGTISGGGYYVYVAPGCYWDNPVVCGAGEIYDNNTNTCSVDPFYVAPTPTPDPYSGGGDGG